MKNKTPDFAYHMTKFFTEYLPIQRNLSPNSIATYRDTFRLLLLFYDTEKHIKPNLLTLDMLNVQQIVKETIGVGVNEKAVLRFYQTALSFTSISIFPW